MKILFVIDRYEPSRGGAESYLHDLAAALGERGHHVSVAAITAETDPVVTPIRLSIASRPRLVREFRLAQAPGRLMAEGAFDVVVAFRHAFDADLFQPHGGLHIESLKGAVRPFAASGLMVAFLLFRKLLSPKNILFLAADRWLLRRAGRPPAVAALSRLSARAFPAGVPVTVIPNGVDRRRFHPGLRAVHREGLLAAESIPAASRTGLFCGHNFALKGLEQALRGMAVFVSGGGDMVLLVVGRGRQEKYRRLAGRLGIASRVRFLGERRDLDRLYGASDVLLHPTFYDPCSLVVVEALGAGVPVVTTRFNGAAELMTDGREGFVLRDPRDSRAISRALGEILGPDWETFRRNAARLGEEQDFSRHADKMEKLLAACAGKRNSAAKGDSAGK
jgi:UDP-glucose:(heptosyl)LPS alpha-1,3-glucosyltransferase